MFTHSKSSFLIGLASLTTALSLAIALYAANKLPNDGGRAEASEPATIPPVLLSQNHEKLCRIKVGEALPDFELEQLTGGRGKLSELLGKTATVVLFWKSDQRMSGDVLADLGPDVGQPYGAAGVTVVGVAVQESAADAKGALSKASAKFPNFLDADGAAFAKVGSEKMPRIFLLDPNGKVLWFDIEYSITTRRELHKALLAVAGEPAASNGN